jgi:hypothetical protein
MVFNAILNASKRGLQRDRSTHRRAILNASKVGIPFFFLRLRMRRNHNGLACQNYLRGLLLRANRGQPTGWRVAPVGIWGANSDVLTSGNWKQLENPSPHSRVTGDRSRKRSDGRRRERPAKTAPEEAGERRARPPSPPLWSHQAVRTGPRRRWHRPPANLRAPARWRSRSWRCPAGSRSARRPWKWRRKRLRLRDLLATDTNLDH